jgi:hypothetical protein
MSPPGRFENYENEQFGLSWFFQAIPKVLFRPGSIAYPISSGKFRCKTDSVKDEFERI